MSAFTNEQKVAVLQELLGDPAATKEILGQVVSDERQLESLGVVYKEAKEAVATKMAGGAMELTEAQLEAMIEKVISRMAGQAETEEEADADTGEDEEMTEVETKMEGASSGEEDEEEEEDASTTKEEDGQDDEPPLYLTIKEASTLAVDFIEAAIETGHFQVVSTKEQATEAITHTVKETVKEAVQPVLDALAETKKELASTRKELKEVRSKVAELVGEQPRGFRASTASETELAPNNTLKEQTETEPKTPQEELMLNLAKGVFPAWQPPA